VKKKLKQSEEKYKEVLLKQTKEKLIQVEKQLQEENDKYKGVFYLASNR